MSPDSAAAAVYAAWQRTLQDTLYARLLPPEIRTSVPGRSLAKVIGWIETAEPMAFPGGAASRDRFLLETLGQAASLLKKRFGSAIDEWRYGDKRFHHVLIRHPLGTLIPAEERSSLDVGPLPRGGNGQTVNMTSDFDNQAAGATFRIAVDLADWDLARGTNSPGQSGDPASPHYADLFGPWAEGRYFPAYFSREKILGAAERTIRLEPEQ
jgi:penicillin amidase